MNQSTQTALGQFAESLAQCAVVAEFRALEKQVAANPESRQRLDDLEQRMPLNNIAVIRQNRGFYADIPLLNDYFDARIAVLQLLQQINSILSTQIRINIAASLQPASCCG